MKPLSRRQFLLGTGAAVALFPIGYAVRVSWGGYSFPQSFKHLSAKEAVILSALLEAMLPSKNAFNLTHEEAESLRNIDAFLDASSPLERSEIHLLIWAIEHLFPAIGGNFQKFSKMDLSVRRKILLRLDNSEKAIPRMLLRVSKTLVAFGYIGSEAMREKLGIKGWCGP